MPTPILGGLREAEEIEVSGSEDLSQPGFITAQPDIRGPSKGDNRRGRGYSQVEGDIRVTALVLAAESASVTAANGHGAQRGERDSRRRHPNVELPKAVTRLETVQALLVEPRRLVLEILGALQSSHELALEVEGARQVIPATASKILVHVVPCQLPALVSFAGLGLRQRRKTFDVEALIYDDGVGVGAPLHHLCPCSC